MAQVEKTGNGSGSSGILGDVSVEDAQQLVEQTRQAVDQAVEQAAGFIRERPIVSLAGALAIGYLLGKIVSR
jgi:ElaB/YqjD/DUF883 family membrane-anchored ribosome-binding protein